MPDNPTKPTPSVDTDQSEEKVEDLPQKPIAETDASVVKGGSSTPHMIQPVKTISW